ncbi:MAG: formylglycine-generating enzyme family protein [Chitinophagaceae bacterium]|nr:formylglycine-generating enzyme family protein [Chitinophagaceae bacterium]MCW5927342.1 formylglycine-generating enzyme family protein [Chitinophagaceae bacterium]
MLSRILLSVVIGVAMLPASAQKIKKNKNKPTLEINAAAISRAFLDSIELNMVWVTGGSFIMGDNMGEIDEKPAHEVVINGFAISKYQVTQRQWGVIMGNYESDYKICGECPIDNISWRDAQEFIRRLNLITGKHYTLPTEAEWEFAAKGGKDGKGYRFSGSDNIDEVGWHAGNSERHPHPVGEKEPNELGLYDMTGNMWEWCQDRYTKFYYEENIKYSPEGPSEGSGRVRRGGSWFTSARNCRTSARSSVKEDYKDNSITFRLAQYPN